jgi:hypothetical protein
LPYPYITSRFFSLKLTQPKKKKKTVKQSIQFEEHHVPTGGGPSRATAEPLLPRDEKRRRAHLFFTPGLVASFSTTRTRVILCYNMQPVRKTSPGGAAV